MSEVWKAHAALVVTKIETPKIDDAEDHHIFFSEWDGVAFSDKDKGLFLDKARYQVVHLGDTAGMVNGGYKTFTTTDGSKVFARYQVTEAAPPDYKGEWEFIGGTGQYKGISGKGIYILTMNSETTAFDILEGEYELP